MPHKETTIGLSLLDSQGINPNKHVRRMREDLIRTLSVMLRAKGFNEEFTIDSITSNLMKMRIRTHLLLLLAGKVSLDLNKIRVLASELSELILGLNEGVRPYHISPRQAA